MKAPLSINVYGLHWLLIISLQ